MRTQESGVGSQSETHVRRKLSGLRKPRVNAFTLIELLVVIAIMAILAAMIFPVLHAVTRHKIQSRTRAELAQIETAIESYHTKKGFYPPDNPNNPYVSLLYYELSGTVFSNNGYVTLDGGVQLAAAGLTGIFGRDGVVNATKGAGGDEGPFASNFLKPGLRPDQYLAITNGASATPICTLIGNPADGPLLLKNPDGRKLNPWRYVSSNPTNNPKSFDLWIDVLIGSKTNRICNWRQEPFTL